MEKRTAPGAIASLVFAVIAVALGVWIVVTGSPWFGIAWIALGLVWGALSLRAWRRTNAKS